MQIAANQSIPGYPTIAVRNFLRKHELTGFITESAQASLSLSPQDAKELLNKLVDLGLVRESNLLDGFGLTENGVRLAYASAAKPIHRKTASRLLSEFMERVHTVNATPEYLFQVSEVILFGSYLSRGVEVRRCGFVPSAAIRQMLRITISRIALNKPAVSCPTYRNACRAFVIVASGDRRTRLNLAPKSGLFSAQSCPS